MTQNSQEEKVWKGGENMAKEILLEEKIKRRWAQMEEMNQIWDKLSERQKGYLDGCMSTVIALSASHKAG